MTAPFERGNDGVRVLGGGFFMAPNVSGDELAARKTGRIAALALAQASLGVLGAVVLSKPKASASRLVVGSLLCALVPAGWIGSMYVARKWQP